MLLLAWLNPMPGGNLEEAVSWWAPYCPRVPHTDPGCGDDQGKMELFLVFPALQMVCLTNCEGEKKPLFDAVLYNVNCRNVNFSGNFGTGNFFPIV